MVERSICKYVFTEVGGGSISVGRRGGEKRGGEA